MSITGFFIGMAKLNKLPNRLTQQPGAKRATIGASWRNGKTSTERGYGHHWRTYVRPLQLQRNPLCVYCERKGIVTAATIVDHIIPHRGNKALFNDVNNLQSLCKRCHDSTKQREENQAKSTT